MEQLVTEFLHEVSTISTASASASGAGAVATAGGPAHEPQPGTLRDDAIQAALAAPAFRQCALAMAGLDMDTDEGRRSAFDAAFSSGSAIIIRVLAHGSALLARRHPLLAQLHEVRGELYSYFNYCQAVDSSTGELSSRGMRWSWTDEDNSDDTQLSLFLRQKYAAMDWVNPPLGALGWKAVFTGQRLLPVDPRDHYVIVSVLEEICSFGERTFTAFGLPTDVPTAQGYSWKTFFVFYIDHVKLATRLSSRAEQFNWLEKADKQCRAALRCMGNEVRRRIESATPATSVFGAILPHDAKPICAMKEQQAALEKLADFREQFDWLRDAETPAVRVNDLPLLSEGRGTQGAGPSRAPHSPARSRSPSPSRSSSARPARVSFRDDGSSGDDASPKRSRLPSGGKGKGKAADGRQQGGDPQRGDADGPQPTHLWLVPQKLLFVSGRVWDIPATAKSLNVAVGAKCWPVVLSRRTARNKMSECERRGKPGHKKLGDAAHILDVDYTELEGRKGLWRAPTSAEHKR